MNKKIKDMSVGELMNTFLLNASQGEDSVFVNGGIKQGKSSEVADELGLDQEVFMAWVRRNMANPREVMAMVFTLLFEGTRLRILASGVTNDPEAVGAKEIVNAWDRLLGEEFNMHDARCLMAKIDLATMEASKQFDHGDRN